jgi:hypothetical protein
LTFLFSFKHNASLLAISIILLHIFPIKILFHSFNSLILHSIFSIIYNFVLIPNASFLCYFITPQLDNLNIISIYSFSISYFLKNYKLLKFFNSHKWWQHVAITPPAIFIDLLALFNAYIDRSVAIPHICLQTPTILLYYS